MILPMADELAEAIRAAAAARCLKANEYIRLALIDRVAADGVPLKATQRAS
jgi:hypothetical protein